MKLFIDEKNSNWGIEHIERTAKDGSTKLDHFIMSRVKYEAENGEIKESYAKIRLDDLFFAVEDKDSKTDKKANKKGKKVLNDLTQLTYMNDIKKILKDGSFDVDMFQHEAKPNQPQHMVYSIIPLLAAQEGAADDRVLVLGGFKGDNGVYFISPASRSCDPKRKGKSTVISFAKSKGKKSEEWIAREAERMGGVEHVEPTFVRAIQFAALLAPGDTVAYKVSNYEKKYDRVLTRVVSYTNNNGIIVPGNFTPNAWKNAHPVSK